MEHEYVKDLLSAYYDRELTPEQTALVADHLKTCSECQTELDKLDKLQRLVEEQSQLSSGDYWEKSAQKIESRLGGGTVITDVKPEKEKNSGLGWKLVAVAASVVFLTWVGVNRDMLLPGESDSQSDSGPTEVIPEEEATLEFQLQDQPMPADQRSSDTEYDTETRTEQGERQPQAQKKSTPTVPVSTGEESRREQAEDELGDEEAGLVVPVDLDVVEVAVGRKARNQAAAKSEGIDRFNELEVDKLKEEYAEEENYRRDKARSSIAVEVPPDLRGDIILKADESQVYSVESSEGLVANELTYWRSRIDSLTQARNAAKDSLRIKLGSREHNLDQSFDIKSRASGLLPGFSSESDLIKADSVARLEKSSNETELLKAWYEVCRLSPDSSETQKGIGFLRSVAADQESSNRSLASSLLAKLGLD